MEITVINLGEPANPVVKDLLESAGAQVYTFPFPRLFSPASFLEIVNFVRRERFDLIQSYLAYSNIIGALAGQISGIPVIGSLRSTGDNPQAYSRKREFLDNLALRYGCKRVLANGYAVAEFGHKRLGNIHIDVIPNAVELVPPLLMEERRRFREQIVGNADRPLILSVGRMDYRKGFPDLLRGFADICSCYPTAALVIAGGGDMFDGLLSQVHALNLENHVFLLGSRDDVPRLLAIADIYVNSSTSEGMPVSVLEAMAAGLPVIATAVGDTPYVVQPGTGLLISPGEPDQIAEAIKRLLASPAECTALGRAAREHIYRHHSLSVWRKKMLELYIQVTPSARHLFEQYINE
jgi:glycosyltransferase involved in cell wall biosynthesis